MTSIDFTYNKYEICGSLVVLLSCISWKLRKLKTWTYQSKRRLTELVLDKRKNHLIFVKGVTIIPGNF